MREVVDSSITSFRGNPGQAGNRNTAHLCLFNATRRRSEEGSFGRAIMFTTRRRQLHSSSPQHFYMEIWPILSRTTAPKDSNDCLRKAARMAPDEEDEDPPASACCVNFNVRGWRLRTILSCDALWASSGLIELRLQTVAIDKHPACHKPDCENCGKQHPDFVPSCDGDPQRDPRPSVRLSWSELIGLAPTSRPRPC